jgi:DNA polymerase-4
MHAIRKIIHVDMDAFFAAVEQRDFPRYRGKPLVVGGMPDSRGVVSTCSYEARKYGIHSAMPAAHAYRLCPQAIFVKPRFDAYREAAQQIRAIFSEYTDVYEPLSLDEAYLDVSDADCFRGSATLIAKDIKGKIERQTALTASAGISYNKFLAKIASDINKPDGLYVITPDMAERFIAQLPVGKFHGIGRATEVKMHELGIRNGAELRQYSLEILLQHFGKAGSYYYHIARGIDNRPVSAHRESKSIGAEITFQQDLGDARAILLHLQSLFEKVLGRAQDKNLCAHTLTVKIKYHDFEQITRSRTAANAIDNIGAAMKIILRLLQSTETGRRKVRLLGVILSNLQAPGAASRYRQLDLFSEYAGNEEL